MKRRFPRPPRALVIALALWVLALSALRILSPFLHGAHLIAAIVLMFIGIVFACIRFRLPGVALALVIPLTLLILGLYALWRFDLVGPFLVGPTFQMTAFVLAFIAIVFACIQFRDARGHSKRMEEIGRSMSTRYIGVFPKDLDDIVEVVAAADRELLVMADCVDYGHYSKPETYEKLLDQLKEARDRGVNVRFLVYNQETALQALNQQFPPDKFTEILSTPEFNHYFKMYSGISRPGTHAEFRDTLFKKDNEVVGQLRDRGAGIRLLPKEERLFFWLGDDEDAVFSFENIGAGEPLCFRTRDAMLIETFRCIFNRNWNPPEEVKTEQLAKTA